MKHVWYIHKWYRSNYRGCLRLTGGYDRADRVAAKLERSYGRHGWSYRICSTSQLSLFVEHGAHT